MSKLVYLVNAVVLDNVFFFKSSNTIVMNYEFKFDSIVVILDNDI